MYYYLFDREGTLIYEVEDRRKGRQSCANYPGTFRKEFSPNIADSIDQEH